VTTPRQELRRGKQGGCFRHIATMLVAKEFGIEIAGAASLITAKIVNFPLIFLQYRPVKFRVNGNLSEIVSRTGIVGQAGFFDIL
jgi:hypothetical protein